ncbi:MAG: 50S ribosomal protein L19 [Candidatus Omnitrophica bacterium]|nr:50S ribosomal protein L19 [Candidatus Omnitrophota bacterium]
MDLKVQAFEKEMMKKKIPDFKIGDTVVVSVRIQEGNKSRIQDFEGIVIARKTAGVRSVFTVRRISYGEGVERIFPLYSPFIEKIKVQRKGKVSRAKLYYLRDKVGKKGRIEERVDL